MFKFKKLKIAKQLTSADSVLKWLKFAKKQDSKMKSEYLNTVVEDEKSGIVNKPSSKLEAMVRETLIKEFSPSIQNSKSYELLVDAVMHNLKKKQIEAFEKYE